VDLAAELARYVPKSARRILDPCTGNGALIRPLLSADVNLFAVDIRSSAITVTKKTFQFSRRLCTRQGDFLRIPLGRWEKYMDCVIMNPPFSGKRESYVTSEECNGIHRTSIEVAFVRKGIQCLRQGGRLVAIVPPSIVCGQQFKSLRSWL